MPFQKRLQDLEVQEKESATFQCEVPLPSTEAAWYKEETRLWASAKYGIEEAGTERRLTVRNVSADDDAVYICETAEGSRTVAELAVRGGRRLGVGRGKGGQEVRREEEPAPPPPDHTPPPRPAFRRQPSPEAPQEDRGARGGHGHVLRGAGQA